jgi:hypothetical protein
MVDWWVVYVESIRPFRELIMNGSCVDAEIVIRHLAGRKTLLKLMKKRLCTREL